MKNKLLISLSFFPFFLNAQFGELSFQYRYGISTDNFQKPSIETNSYVYRDAKTLNDQGFIFTYGYPISKRFHVNANIGFEIAETKRYVPLVEPKDYRQLANIDMNTNRASYRLGITKDFHFYESKVQISLGMTFLKRNHLKNNIVYQSEYNKKENVPWIEYKYVLTSNYDEEHRSSLPIYSEKLFNTEYSIAFKLQVIENLFVSVNFAYSRNYHVLYDKESTFRYYIGGSTTPTYTINSHGLFYSQGDLESKRDHFLYTGIGASYDFNFKQKEATKL